MHPLAFACLFSVPAPSLATANGGVFSPSPVVSVRSLPRESDQGVASEPPPVTVRPSPKGDRNALHPLPDRTAECLVSAHDRLGVGPLGGVARTGQYAADPRLIQ